MRTKIKNEEKASGISPTRSEVEEALEYLIEKEDASDEIHKNNMNRKEREKTEEVRKVAMESLGTTTRRKENEKENSVDCKPKRRRSAGSETVAYLREKSVKERQGKAEEIGLRKAQLELEQKKTLMCCKCCNSDSNSSSSNNNNKCKLLQCCSSSNSNSRLNFS